MHIIFSEQEKEWIDTRVFGWKIKKECPKNILKSIEKKKKLLDNQMGSRANGNDKKRGSNQPQKGNNRSKK